MLLGGNVESEHGLSVGNWYELACSSLRQTRMTMVGGQTAITAGCVAHKVVKLFAQKR